MVCDFQEWSQSHCGFHIGLLDCSLCVTPAAFLWTHSSNPGEVSRERDQLAGMWVSVLAEGPSALVTLSDDCRPLLTPDWNLMRDPKQPPNSWPTEITTVVWSKPSSEAIWNSAILLRTPTLTPHLSIEAVEAIREVKVLKATARVCIVEVGCHKGLSSLHPKILPEKFSVRMW